MGYHLKPPVADRASHPENGLPRLAGGGSGRRSYSPGLGRFLRRDPIGEGGGLNSYAFVENDASDNVDFVGNKTESTFRTGRIYCTDKCDMEIQGCDTWGAAADCCAVHEEVHIRQLHSQERMPTFCVYDESTCECHGAGRTARFDLDMPEQSPLGMECEALRSSWRCCQRLWNSLSASAPSGQSICDAYLCLRAIAIGSDVLGCGLPAQGVVEKLRPAHCPEHPPLDWDIKPLAR